jgi:hypothetical protein
MPTAEPPLYWHRQLPDYITVAVDGVYDALTPEDAEPGARPIGRIVINMPDFVADTFAHNLVAVWQFADRVNAETITDTERALAEALFAAAAFMGCPCPNDRL